MHLGIANIQPLILYIGAIVVFFLAVCWKPEIGLYYLIPLLPMQRVRQWLHDYPFGEKLVDIILLGVIIGLIIHSKRPLFLSSPFNKVLILFWVLLYFGLWQGAFYLGGPLPILFDDPRFSDWKNYVEMMFLFFAAAAVIRTPRQMQIVIGLMCLSILTVNRSYYYTMEGRDFTQFSYSLREAGALGYAGENGMGAFQAQCAVFLIGLSTFMKQKWMRLGLWGIALTCIYCLLLTFSRGGYIGFLFGLLVIGLIKERKLLVLLFAILLTWQSLVPQAVTDRVLMTYSEGEGVDSSAGERLDLWQDALQVFDHDPVMGTGFDTYRYMGRVGGFTDTHNYYIKVLLELGLVGIFVFLWLLASAGRMAWRLFRSAKEPTLGAIGCAYFAMLSTACLVNFFGDRWTYLQVNGFFWIFLGMVARGLVLVKQEQGSSEALLAEVAVHSPATAKTSHA